MRIDKFLKVSRILKRRSVANEACGKELVYVNDKPAKPSYQLKIGDIVTINFNTNTLKFKVVSLNEKANKEQSKELYEILQ